MREIKWFSSDEKPRTIGAVFYTGLSYECFSDNGRFLRERRKQFS